MKLIIVRHGQTEENVSKIIQGQSAGRLNDLGRKQAKKVGLRLKGEKIDVAYVSDLERAKRTADEILKYHPMTPVVYTEALRERHYGIWEGKKRAERDAFLQQQRTTPLDFTPEGGESYQALEQRVWGFYNLLMQKHPSDTVLVISHGGTLTALYLTLFQKSRDEYAKYHPENTAVTIVEISKNKKHTVHVLNCIKHLE